MIDFIFFISIIVIIMLVVSFVYRIFVLGLISSMAIVAIGVSILSQGVLGIENILTLTWGTIFVTLGSYIFINGSLEQIENY